MCMPHEQKTSCLKESQIDNGYWGEYNQKINFSLVDSN